ncbi:large subunit viral early transcription factor [Pteropox virus]|uniref:Early transcription factor 82 kDa subunit n=1 Tax=Pteropox virus TaxID=1873698 RepID=A0A1B1MRM6_9POXV|nr:large subunit viral early transcription factor [Pteropox virus]ANS71185.1 large subunit viral early transcription factor [Pteropox virus]
MIYTVSPQLVLLVDASQNIERALYLTPYNEIDETSTIYYFLSKHLDIKTPTLLKRHILLTMKIRQLKGYLQDLLNIDENIIIYSHKNNLEYSYVDNTIFNPFSPTQKKTLIKIDGILYNTYIDACNFLVIWVARANDTPVPEFGSSEEVNSNILKFESKMLEIFNTLDLNMTVESKFNNIFRTNLRTTGLRKIVKKLQEQNLKNKVLLYKSDEHFINLTGNNFILTDEDINLTVWNTDGTVALSSDGSTITVNNISLFSSLVADLDPQMERIKGDITYKVNLFTPITSKIKLAIETSFIFVETATNNILLSVDKRISIILAKNHISIKVKNHIPNIEKYFAFLVIAINSMFNNVQQSSDFTKIETVYWSRICQNSKNKNRKPVIIQSLDADMTKVSENFYKSETKDVFVNANGVMFSCLDPLGKYNNIGFLSIFHRLQKICIPCCFLKPQSHTETFSSCVHNKEVDRTVINPYVLNFGKVVTESKISFLPILFDDYFNVDNNADFEPDNKRLQSTSGYYIVHCCAKETITRLRTQEDIIKYVNEDKNILIVGDMVYFPTNYTDIGNKIRIVVQEIVHDVLLVQKDADSDVINFIQPKSNPLKKLFPYIDNKIEIASDSGLTLTTDGFYVDGERFTETISSQYITFTDNVVSSGPIVKYFSNMFKYVVTKSIDRFIKTWIVNIMVQFNITPTTDPATVKQLLEKYYPHK